MVWLGWEEGKLEKTDESMKELIIVAHTHTHIHTLTAHK